MIEQEYPQSSRCVVSFTSYSVKTISLWYKQSIHRCTNVKTYKTADKRWSREREKRHQTSIKNHLNPFNLFWIILFTLFYILLYFFVYFLLYLFRLLHWIFPTRINEMLSYLGTQQYGLRVIFVYICRIYCFINM